MRLTVLGGGAAGPNPGVGCSGYLITNDGSAIVLDLGPGTLQELKRHIDPRLLDGIVISHPHLDHILDVASLRYSLKYAPSSVRTPVSLWVTPGSLATLDHLARAFCGDDDPALFYDGVFDIRVYDPEQPLTLGAFTITFAPTVHYIPAFAMRIEISPAGPALVYTADTGPASQLDKRFQNASVLVAEAALADPGLEPEMIRGHLTAEEAGQLANRMSVRTLLLTHLWEEMGLDSLRQRATTIFHGRVEIARPGLLVDV